MVLHIAAFNWADGTAPEDAERLLAGVRAIADDVDGIHEIHCGRNESPLTQGLQHAIFVRAADLEALERYRVDERHVAAGAAMDADQTRDEAHQPGLVVRLLA